MCRGCRGSSDVVRLPKPALLRTEAGFSLPHLGPVSPPRQLSWRQERRGNRRATEETTRTNFPFVRFPPFDPGAARKRRVTLVARKSRTNTKYVCSKIALSRRRESLIGQRAPCRLGGETTIAAIMSARRPLGGRGWQLTPRKRHGPNHCHPSERKPARRRSRYRPRRFWRDLAIRADASLAY